MMRWVFWVILAVLLIIVVSGCQELLQPVSTEPNAPILIEPVVETGIGLAGLLGVLWPPLIPIATAAGGLFAGYKQLKPKLDEATSSKDKYFAGGEALAGVLENIKTENPDVWKLIGPKITEATKATNDIGAAIDGFRGKA